jgi:hypothetical protein
MATPMRRFVALLIVLALAGSPAVAGGVAGPAASAHGCCKVKVQAAPACHDTRVSCCKPAPRPERESTPAASGPLVAAPELLVLHPVAAIAPDVTAAARASALAAHAQARFKSPPDPVYLRNAVLLV